MICFCIFLFSILSLTKGFIDQNDCDFTCPNDQQAVMKSNSHLEANGCGSSGISVSSNVDFTDCCNWHDACYGICGMKKNDCEKRFEKCMRRLCLKQSSVDIESCIGTSDIYLMGVKFMGCSAYKSSQEQSCQCVKKGREEEIAIRNTLISFLNQHDPSKSQDDQYVEDLLEKYKDNSNTLFLRLAHKYPKSLIMTKRNPVKEDL